MSRAILMGRVRVLESVLGLGSFGGAGLPVFWCVGKKGFQFGSFQFWLCELSIWRRDIQRFKLLPLQF